MYRKGRECLHWQRDGRRLGDAKEGKDEAEASGLAKWGSERGRHCASGLQTKGQGKSEADEEAGGQAKAMMGGGRKSRVRERDVGEEGRHLCGGRG